MLDIRSINTNPLTNDYCKKCTFYKTKKIRKNGNEAVFCYSVDMLMTSRKNCIKPFQYNSDVLSNSIIEWDLLPRYFNTKVIRFNSHGELINKIHLENLNNIVKKNHDVFFGLWTKQFKLIKEFYSKNKKPKNMNIIFSNSKFNAPMQKIPLYFDKTFNVITKDSDIPITAPSNPFNISYIVILALLLFVFLYCLLYNKSCNLYIYPYN